MNMDESTTQNLRELRGLEIAKAKENQIDRLDNVTYKVRSQSGNCVYLVSKLEDGGFVHSSSDSVTVLLDV